MFLFSKLSHFSTALTLSTAVIRGSALTTQAPLLPSLESPRDRCLSLPNFLSHTATTTYLPAGSIVTIRTPPGCEMYSPSSTTNYTLLSSTCRVQANIHTSQTSKVHLEAWLPDSAIWTGRLLSLGNGGLSGCFYYHDLISSSNRYNMATVQTDNGHTGDTAAPMLNNPEVLNDFGWRALEVEYAVGMEITKAYYSRRPDRKYFLGCSAGGRQGVYLAQKYPEYYDGIVAGAPVIDAIHLFSKIARDAVGMGARSENSTYLLTLKDVPVITKGVLDQCDKLDGVVNGIIDDPSECKFKPEKLLCTKKQLNEGNTAGVCLDRKQVDAVRQLFTPLYGPKGEVLYTSFDPGFTGSKQPVMFEDGLAWKYSMEVYRNMIYNDTSYNLDYFSQKDITLADSINPGDFGFWNPDLSIFRSTGGKLLSYHGTADNIVPSLNTLRYYNSVQTSLRTTNLDSFWKHFPIPGMDHCIGSTSTGSAAWNFAQLPVLGSGVANDTQHNILWALVDWVENGNSPKELIGTKFVDDVTGGEIETQRRYCPWPSKSVLRKGMDASVAGSWICV